VLSHKAILDHVTNYGKALNFSKDDKIINWLPLYHDMGLIAAFHLPLACGLTTVQLDPFEWVLYPLLLLEAISKEMGTLVWLPNFAYNLMADKIHEEDLAGVDLRSVRMLVNCSEPVRAESHDKFFERFSKYGLSPGTLSACYAMAETTFAATQTAPGLPAGIIAVDRDQLAKGFVKLVNSASCRPARRCVSSGKPIEGVALRILGPDGSERGDDAVGEIVIRSVSLFDGYRNNPEVTAAAFKDGWYCSGDYGFRHGGEYFIIGRKKDIIIIAGKNIYPEDVEDAVGKVKGVAPGRVVAFGEEDAELGTERISVIAETSFQSETEKSELSKRICEAGLDADLTITKVYLVPPRWLIKSSSGKPSRKANRERIRRPEPG
jgi:acyl-CoA synthetase (AMP-forming)/AMP-acid ligase II